MTAHPLRFDFWWVLGWSWCAINSLLCGLIFRSQIYVERWHRFMWSCALLTSPPPGDYDTERSIIHQKTHPGNLKTMGVKISAGFCLYWLLFEDAAAAFGQRPMAFCPQIQHAACNCERLGRGSYVHCEAHLGTEIVRSVFSKKNQPFYYRHCPSWWICHGFGSRLATSSCGVDRTGPLVCTIICPLQPIHQKSCNE